MSLILAIEPDRKQAAQLTAVIRRRLNAELLLAATTEQALEAIGSRVPDLVLVPALLSPSDDAALAGALRVIATAAHVRMLTIPVLASKSATEGSRGVFGLLRRGRSENAATEGCDPNVFAEQVASYLRQSAEDRAAVQHDDFDDDGERTAAAPSVAGTETAEEDVTPISFAATEPSSSWQSESGSSWETTVHTDGGWQSEAAEPEYPRTMFDETEPGWQTPLPQEPAWQETAQAAPEPERVWEQPAPIEPVWQEPAPPEPAWQATAEPEPILAWEPATIELIDADDEEEPAVLARPTNTDESTVLEEELDPDEIDLSSELETDEDLDFDSFVAREFDHDEPYELSMFSDEPVLELIEPEPLDAADELVACSRAPEIDDSDLWSPLGAVAHWPSFPVDRTVVEIVAHIDGEADFSAFAIRPTPVFAAPPKAAQQASKPAPQQPATTTATPEWVALIESLRHDIERLRKEPAAPPPAPAIVAARPKKRPQTRPAQDEWGFFDPEQCGFTALLAKLDEVTKEPDDIPAA